MDIGVLSDALQYVEPSWAILGLLKGIMGGGGEKSRVEQHKIMSPEQEQMYNAVLALLGRNTNFGQTPFETTSLAGLEQLMNNINFAGVNRASGGMLSSGGARESFGGGLYGKPSQGTTPTSSGSSQQPAVADNLIDTMLGVALQNPGVQTAAQLINLKEMSSRKSKQPTFENKSPQHQRMVWANR